MESVTWKPISGYPDYEVSNDGRVKSVAREFTDSIGRTYHKSEKILSPVLEEHGYRKVNLGKSGRQFRVHQLVAAAFMEDQPEGTEINHKDGNKSNNAVTNLEFVTRLGNVRHAISTGLQDNRGEKNGMAKFTNRQIQESYDLVRSGVPVSEASRKTGVTEGSIRKTIEGKRAGFARII